MNKWLKGFITFVTYGLIAWGLLLIVFSQVIFPWTYTFPRPWDATLLPREEALKVPVSITIPVPFASEGSITLATLTAMDLTYLALGCLIVGIVLLILRRGNKI